MEAKRFARLPVLAFAALLAGCWPDNAEVGKAKHFSERARVGEPLVLKLPGKPRMGYVWRLNSKASGGLERVRVDRLGWSFEPAPRGSGSYTRPGVLRYAVVPLKTGPAHLVFEYFRGEPGASPSARWSWDIDILAAAR